MDDAALTVAKRTADALHHHWLHRQPVVVVLDVDLADLRARETSDAAPWELDPDFEFSRERLARLVTANNYDYRDASPVWGPAKRAVDLGAVESGPADVVLPSGAAAWCDGGPREPLDVGGVAIVHRESIEHGDLRPDRSTPVSADLAADQLAAVAHRRGPARVIAPAGSGKTRVLTARLRHLLRDRGVTDATVTAVAYNNRAARELRSRTEDLGAQIRTLNSLGLAIVNGTGPFLSTGARRQVIDESAVRGILEGLLDVRPKANTDIWAPYIAALSAIRLGLADPRAVETEIPDAEGIAEAFERYRAVLRDRELLDFDEQIYGAIEVLLRDPAARSAAQATTRHLLVDEFQDLTPAHVLMLRLLAAPAYDVFGVGDDDQVIYSYAAASPEFLIDYDGYFPGAAKYALEVNYRCPPEVVDATRNLLSHNATRIAKTIRPAPGKPADASALQVVSRPDDEHAQRTVEQLREWSERGCAWHSMAVLTRVNSALLPIQVALVADGIPCVAPLEVTILRRTGIRTALAYLRIALNPDAIAVADVVDTIRRPSRRLTKEAAELLTSGGSTSVVGLRQAVGRLNESEASKVALYVRDLETVASAAKRGTTAAVRAIRDDIGLGRAVDVLDSSRREADRSTHADDLAALEQAAALHSDAATFESWLGTMLGAAGSPDGVMLSTVHRVKGQEWPRVVVLGADKGSFPHRRATDEEEERRIFHVAITRASEAVVVVADTEEPSPFCVELRQPASPRVEPPPGERRTTPRVRHQTRRPVQATPALRPPAMSAELGVELDISGGIHVQIVDWNKFSAVAATGKSRMNLPWDTEVSMYGQRYLLAPPPPPPADLLDALMAWRRERARTDAVGIDHVLTDAQLHTIALRAPTTIEDLADIPFMGPSKLDDFGDEILAAVEQHT